MNEAVKRLLTNNGYNLDKYIYVSKTCDNIKIKHKKTGKIINIRW